MQKEYVMHTRARPLAAASRALVALLAIITCRSDQGPEAPIQRTAARPSFATAPVGAVTLVGAGNIARCDRANDEATAALLDGISGTVFALGDAADPNGTATTYSNCYNASWGRHNARTYPVLGNHASESSATAARYFSHFGARAAARRTG